MTVWGMYNSMFQRIWKERSLVRVHIYYNSLFFIYSSLFVQDFTYIKLSPLLSAPRKSFSSSEDEGHR